MDGPNDRLATVRTKLLRVIAILRQRLQADEPEHATPPPRREGAERSRRSPTEPAQAPDSLPTLLPVPSSLPRARRKRDSRLRLSRQIPRRDLELPRQAQSRLQLKALDIPGAHLARRVGRDPENVAQFRVIQAPNKLLKALAEISNGHQLRIT